MKEINFKIDKDAFKGPFRCHNQKTKLIEKQLSLAGDIFSYSVWLCLKCKKEYLDTDQAKKLEAIWMFEKILNNKILSMKRNLNYDGKMFFLRFPKELTKEWKKGQHADIKLLEKNKFIVEVKT